MFSVDFSISHLRVSNNCLKKTAEYDKKSSPNDPEKLPIGKINLANCKLFDQSGFISLLDCTHLKELILDNTLGFGWNTGRICQLFKQHGSRFAQSLEKLSLVDTEISDLGIQILADVEFPNLQELNLSRTRITDAAIEFWANGSTNLVGPLATLSTLKLNGTSISKNSFRFFTQSQGRFSQLSHLNLSDTKISLSDCEILKNELLKLENNSEVNVSLFILNIIKKTPDFLRASLFVPMPQYIVESLLDPKKQLRTFKALVHHPSPLMQLQKSPAPSKLSNLESPFKPFAAHTLPESTPPLSPSLKIESSGQSSPQSSKSLSCSPKKSFSQQLILPSHSLMPVSFPLKQNTKETVFDYESGDDEEEEEEGEIEIELNFSRTRKIPNLPLPEFSQEESDEEKIQTSFFQPKSPSESKLFTQISSITSKNAKSSKSIITRSKIKKLKLESFPLY